MLSLTYIYALRDPRPGNRKAYVGKADDPFDRLHGNPGHLKDKKINHRTCWIKGLKALGLEPTLEVLDEVPVAEWQLWEREWIRLYRALQFELVNGTDGGDGGATMTGRKLSPESRAKMSAAQAGKKRSPETGAKISAAKRGKKLSPEHCAAISAAGLGRRDSPETLAKKSARCTGSGNPMFGKFGELNPSFGHPHSAETRAKISAAVSGDNNVHLGTARSPAAIALTSVANTGRKPGNATSKFHNVSLRKAANNWQAGVNLGGKHFYLGVFKVEEDAARAADSFVRANKLSPKLLNFP